ncbi:TPA: hypothetical protein KCH25_003220 [Escherichia coli]|nr:hypothetical protein [Escherichia coli]
MGNSKIANSPALAKIRKFGGVMSGMVMPNLGAFVGWGLMAAIFIPKEGANKQVISSQADSLIKISRIWADFFPANTSNQPI